MCVGEIGFAVGLRSHRHEADHAVTIASALKIINGPDDTVYIRALFLETGCPRPEWKMFKLSRISSYSCAFLAVVCLTHSLCRAGSLEEPRAGVSSEPVLHSWMEAIADASRRGGGWLIASRLLQFGASSQTAQALPPLFRLYGLGRLKASRQ